jgi:hypothetical protein
MRAWRVIRNGTSDRIADDAYWDLDLGDSRPGRRYRAHRRRPVRRRVALIRSASAAWAALSFLDNRVTGTVYVRQGVANRRDHRCASRHLERTKACA